MDAQNIDDTEYWMEDMTILPDIMTLDVRVIANEHAFGASLFHVLRLCSGIKKLTLDLSPPQFGGNCYPFNLYNIHLHFLVHQVLIC